MWEYLLENIWVLILCVMAIVAIIVLAVMFFVFWLPKLKSRPKKQKNVVVEAKEPDALKFDINRNKIENEMASEEARRAKDAIKKASQDDLSKRIEDMQKIGKK